MFFSGPWHNAFWPKIAGESACATSANQCLAGLVKQTFGPRRRLPRAVSGIGLPTGAGHPEQRAREGPCRGPFGHNARRLALVLSLSALLAACGHKDSGPALHYAFVGFENLSGDAALDWVCRGASEFLSRSLQSAMPGNGAGGKAGVVVSPEAMERSSQTLGAHPANAPGISAARSGALIAGANRIVTGYVERTAAGVRITASEEDAVTHQAVLTLSATASSPFEALNQLAHRFSDKAGPPPTNNAEALRLYCTALAAPATEAPPLLERAVALDPAFGRAWIALARSSVSLDGRDHVLEVIAQARAQKLAPLDQAWLDVEDASVRSDRTGRLEAMRKASELDPGDTGLGRNLAGIETAAGNFSQAAAVWKRLTVNNPEDTDAWNQLGYTLCWSGDYAGALAALREYARLRPAEANPLDSQGDVYYWFGKFGDAAASYSAAYAKVPGFANGEDLYKGAWARFRTGDKAGADILFGKFREVREKAHDPSIDILAGDWLYRTGREEEAAALLRDALRKASENDAPPGSSAIRAGIAAQLAVWDLLAGDRAAASKDVADGGTSGFTPGDLLVRFAVMPSASASEWETRAARILAAPQLAGLRPAALGYALILDDKKQAALRVWEEIVKESPGTDFFSRAILARLKGQRPEHTPPPDPGNLNEFAAVLDKL